MRQSRGLAAAGCGLALVLPTGACTTEPPEQTPKAVTTVVTTPALTVTATPPSSAAPTVTVTVTPPPPPAAKTSSARKSPWRCEPGYPNCSKAHSEKYLAELEYQKCLRDPEKIWDTRMRKCRYKTSGEVQSEYFDGPTR